MITTASRGLRLPLIDLAQLEMTETTSRTVIKCIIFPTSIHVAYYITF